MHTIASHTYNIPQVGPTVKLASVKACAKNGSTLLKTNVTTSDQQEYEFGVWLQAKKSISVTPHLYTNYYSTYLKNGRLYFAWGELVAN